MFSYEFWGTFKDNYFTQHFRATASNVKVLAYQSTMCAKTFHEPVTEVWGRETVFKLNFKLEPLFRWTSYGKIKFMETIN